jgi:hypothetical protein
MESSALQSDEELFYTTEASVLSESDEEELDVPGHSCKPTPLPGDLEIEEDSSRLSWAGDGAARSSYTYLIFRWPGIHQNLI